MDTFTLLHSFVNPAAAHRWANKTIMVVQNERNKTRNILVLNEDGTPHAWPKYLDGQVQHVIEQIRRRG